MTGIWGRCAIETEKEQAVRDRGATTVPNHLLNLGSGKKGVYCRNGGIQALCGEVDGATDSAPLCGSIPSAGLIIFNHDLASAC